MPFRTCFHQYACALLLTSLAFSSGMSAENLYWPQWRGPQADGVARDCDPPIQWSQTKNVKWKASIPGAGSATPIVWDDQIFVVTAIRTDRVAASAPKANEEAKTQPPTTFYQFVVLCLDRRTGKELWRQVACEQVPHEGKHDTNTYASASPTTGRPAAVRVVRLARNLLLRPRRANCSGLAILGDMRTRFGWGEATSPVVYGDSLVHQLGPRRAILHRGARRGDRRDENGKPIATSQRRGPRL